MILCYITNWIKNHSFSLWSARSEAMKSSTTSSSSASINKNKQKFCVYVKTSDHERARVSERDKHAIFSINLLLSTASSSSFSSFRSLGEEKNIFFLTYFLFCLASLWERQEFFLLLYQHREKCKKKSLILIILPPQE